MTEYLHQFEPKANGLMKTVRGILRSVIDKCRIEIRNRRHYTLEYLLAVMNFGLLNLTRYCVLESFSILLLKKSLTWRLSSEVAGW